MEQTNKKRIMIVEDDSFVMDIYQTKLEQSGFDVLLAVNGVEAIKKLDKKTDLPDLILLDIVMPYMDGLEVLQKIKENEGLSKIPIILLTNLSQKEEIDQGLKMGASDYLIKSHFTPSEVLEKISNYLK
jgi:CheY-like chemotaxis protein